MVRLSKNPKMINIDAYLKDICSYFNNRPDVGAAYLFGSYGTQYQTPLSDVDIAVLFIPETALELETELEISADLTCIAREDDINLVILNKAPITLQFEILSTGRLLCKKEFYLEDFHEYVCKRYADFKIDLDRFNKEYDAVLRKVYLNGKSR
jgi:predicted nucleotidyltransferase